MKYSIILFVFVVIVLCGVVHALGTDVGVSVQRYADAGAAKLQASVNEHARTSASGYSFFSLEKSPYVHLETNVDVSVRKENETDKNETHETVHAHLSNGRNAEIKVMPITASATALAQIGLHVCSEENNCTIILKEVGEAKEMKAAYEMKAQKRVKLFGIFNTTLNVSAEVDAETGKVIKSHWPWWAFLTTNAEASASS